MGTPSKPLSLFDAALDSFHSAGNVTNVGSTLALLAVCFDRFDQPDVAATLFGASTNTAATHYVAIYPAVEEDLRAALGDAAFDHHAAVGNAMDLADAVGYARHHVELARRQAANPDSGRT
jgi:hypothetical protein